MDTSSSSKHSWLAAVRFSSESSEHSVGFKIKIGRPKFYAPEMITPVYKLGTIVIGAWPSFFVWSPL